MLQPLGGDWMMKKLNVSETLLLSVPAGFHSPKCLILQLLFQSFAGKVLAFCSEVILQKKQKTKGILTIPTYFYFWVPNLALLFLQRNCEKWETLTTAQRNVLNISFNIARVVLFMSISLSFCQELITAYFYKLTPHQEIHLHHRYHACDVDHVYFFMLLTSKWMSHLSKSHRWRIWKGLYWLVEVLKQLQRFHNIA